MKIFISILTSLALMLSVVGEANAKRFGGGGFGKSFSSSPFKKSAPKQAPKQAPQQANKPNEAAGTGSNVAKGGMKGGMMGGMLGGLLAGGLFAYLLGSGAFEGIQWMDILLLAGLAFVAFKILGGLAGKQRPQAAYSQAGAGQQGQVRANMHPHAGAAAQQHAANIVDQIDDDTVPMNLPKDFDVVGFINGALDHYRLVQNAWNEGNMATIEEYVAPDLFQALDQQRRQLTVAPHTEVLDLAADIVRADSNGPMHQISILFRGRCADKLEKSEDGIFDTWHLERDTRIDNAPWIIVGIEAE